MDTTLISGTNPANQPVTKPDAAEIKVQPEPAVAQAGAGAVQQADEVVRGNTLGRDTDRDAERVQEQQELDREQLAEIAAELEKFVGGNQRGLSFFVDDQSGEDVVVVKDIANDEIIRQIPSEEVLKLAARMSDLAGFLLDTQA